MAPVPWFETIGDLRSGVQRERPSLYDLTDKMGALRAPTLVLTGDEDWPCLLPGILMKRNIPSAALAVMPNCGHAINLEDPDGFNRIVAGAVNDIVVKQKAAGVDLPSDGEMSKISYATYIKDRITGFDGDSPRRPPADLEDFPPPGTPATVSAL